MIWDVAAVAALRDRGNCRFAKSRMETAPDLRDDFLYVKNENKHPPRYVFKIDRDAIFTELFGLIREAGKEEMK